MMNTRNARYSRWLVFAVLVIAAAYFFTASAAFAQSFRGGIRGAITDAHSLRIAGAKITARNLGTSETREVTADADGNYLFLELTAGEYEVAAMAPGFQEVRAAHVLVSVGEETVVDLKLAKLTEKQEVVMVTEAVPLVETANTTLSQVVSRQLVQELPLNGRDFGKLVALTPGVTVEGSGVAGSEKGFGQFNINGNRDRSNNYTLDGTDNNDPWFNNSALNQVGITGAPATLIPLDAIQEFNLQSQFGAEYGRNSGSVVNIITRSGTNNWHGSLYEYNRNSAFDARNFFNTKPNPQSHFNNNNFGGSLGGPISRDKTFLFFGYEGQRERVGSDLVLTVPQPGQITAARAAALLNPTIIPNGINPALEKILAFMPTSPSGFLPVSISDKNDGDNLIAKLDHRLSGVHSFAVRYAFGNNDQIYPFGSLGGFGSGSRLGAFSQKSPTRVQVVSASWLSAFSSTSINEVRFGYSRFRNQFGSLDDSLDPATLGINFGTGKLGMPEFDFNSYMENLGATIFGIPRGRVSQTYQILDNFTRIRGRHTVKFGGEYRRALVDFSNDNFTRGLFSFDATPPPSGDTGDKVVNALTNFYLGIGAFGFPAGSAEAGNTARNLGSNGLSLFAQDDIRVRPNFTLNLGVRWEYFGPVHEAHNLLSNFDASGNLVMVGSATLPRAYERDLNNFGPRAGFAWNARRNTTVRAAYGLYYDYIPMHLMQANYTNSAGIGANPIGPEAVVPLTFHQDAFNGAAPGSPVFTAGPFSTPSIFITDRKLRTPYVSSWNLNIQQQVGSTLALETGYVGSKGTKLTRLYDLNQGFTNPLYSQIAVLGTGASSTYHALQLSGRLQNWHRFSGFSTYTWSKSLDTASDGIDFNFAGAAFPQDSTKLSAEKGASTFDTRHRWTSAINYQLPTLGYLPHWLNDGWQLNTILTVQSGRPIPILNGNVTQGFFNGHQRPDVVPGVNPILPNWSPTTGYLNPYAFGDPQGPGGTLGRDQIYGPGYKNMDFSFSKNFQLRESLKLQFRTEFFNIFNHPNFSLPANTVFPGVDINGNKRPAANVPPAGTISATPDVAQGNPGLGGGGPRVLQFGLRLQF